MPRDAVSQTAHVGSVGKNGLNFVRKAFVPQAFLWSNKYVFISHAHIHIHTQNIKKSNKYTKHDNSYACILCMLMNFLGFLTVVYVTFAINDIFCVLTIRSSILQPIHLMPEGFDSKTNNYCTLLQY